MANKILIINGVAFRRIETDIRNKKKGSTSHTQTVRHNKNLMNNHSERHHYIPKFFAKGFLGDDNKFFVYDKLKDKVRNKKVSSKEIFYEWNRNTIRSDRGTTDVMENFYSQLDSECSKAIQALRERPNEEGIHSLETVALLRFFVINLFWRVPKTDFAAQDFLKRAKITFTDKETGEIVEKPELKRKLKLDPNHLKSVRPSFPLEIFKKNIAAKKGQINSQLFGFEKDLFLIGDFPILFKKAPTKLDDLLNEDYILPISSKRIYRATQKQLDLKFTLEDAACLNAIIIEQSKFFVCGPSKDHLRKNVDAWKLLRLNGVLPYLVNRIL